MELPILVTVVAVAPVLVLLTLVYLAFRPEPIRPICPECHAAGDTRRKRWWSSAVFVCDSSHHPLPVEFLPTGEKIEQEGGSP